MKEELSIPKHSDGLWDGEIVQVSNHMGDQVKTVCQICLEQFSINQMHVHIRFVHNKSPLEYKEKFGNHINHIRDKVFHKCGVCSQMLLWEFNSIKHHMSRHKMTHGQYNKQFNIVPCKKGFTQKIKHDSNKPSRSEELKKRFPQEHTLTLDNNRIKPVVKENPNHDKESKIWPSIEMVKIEDPLLLREEKTIDLPEVKLKESGLDATLLQIDTFKKKHVTDNEDLELEEGEIPKRSTFGTGLEDKLIIRTVGGKIILSPDTTAKELKTTIASLIEKVFGPAFKCNVCEKIIEERNIMSCHVETHIEGISYPCHLCGKVSRTSNSRKAHKSRHHKKF